MLLILVLVVGLTLFLCWLLFALATLALPLLISVTVAQASWRGGAGLFGALLCGLFAGGATLVVGQVLLATLRGVGSRLCVVLLFSIPAAVAGFSAAQGIAQIGGASSGWAVLLGLGGAAGVAMVAITRLSVAVLAGPIDEPRTRTARSSPPGG